MEVFWQDDGRAGALGIARRRRGTWFDPALVDALAAIEDDTAFWASLDGAAVTAVEPADRVLVADDDGLDRIAEAFARVVDAKSPYTGRHSEGVAEIAVASAPASTSTPTTSAPSAAPACSTTSASSRSPTASSTNPPR